MLLLLLNPSTGGTLKLAVHPLRIVRVPQEVRITKV